ncbi:MAG: hypothetical protein ABSD97_08255, partial [Acidimicrobiales bacterium]
RPKHRALRPRPPSDGRRARLRASLIRADWNGALASQAWYKAKPPSSGERPGSAKDSPCPVLATEPGPSLSRGA